MSKYIIMGAGNIGKACIELLQKFNMGQSIDGFADDDFYKIGEELCNIKIYSIYQAEQLLKKKEIRGIIFPFSLPMYAQHDYFNQLSADNTNCFYLPPLKYMEKEILNAKDIDDLLFAFKDSEYIHTLQIMTVDQCNLNCGGCSHFSSLVKNEKCYSAESFTNDLHRVHTLVKGVGKFIFVGGEPLLHKDLPNMISEVHEVFPESNITIITNALLLLNMCDLFWETVIKHDVFIDVTYYLPVSEKIDKIHDTLKEHGVRYKIWPARIEFKKRVNPSGNSDPEKTWDYCRERSCITMSNGEIATCYMPLVIDYFNGQFGTKIDMSSSVIDLYDSKLTGVDLVNKLTHYQDACRYCHDDVSVPWTRYASPAEAKIENWV